MNAHRNAGVGTRLVCFRSIERYFVDDISVIFKVPKQKLLAIQRVDNQRVRRMDDRL
jgi:hypothetical protein